MELFDKKFVYLEWDEVLEGKKVFLADTLPELRRFVERGYPVWIVKKHDGDYPFVTEGSVVWHAMAYYDPNYECKLAWKNGKQIQSKSTVYVDAEWVDNAFPDWNNPCEAFRIKLEEYEVYMTVFDETETPPKVLITTAVSSMPLHWYVRAKGPLAECTRYAVENYCKRCIHKTCDCAPTACVSGVDPVISCMGFEEPKKWRPFKDITELKQIWLVKNDAKSKGDLYELFIWVRFKNYRDASKLIVGFDKKLNKVCVAGTWFNLSELHEHCEFLDGSPCGVEE